ncbi:MAG: putative DNA binding domain-containing protein [Acidobacteria bacterium]|nr:putative DNA binding domain-containing protein [Acidobacteriota bacterium]
MELLPFNLDVLLNPAKTEDVRVEFKAGWDDHIKQAVTRTICAFANDLPNLNGGYIFLGIEDSQGRPLLPPRGLEGNLEAVQKEIRGQCQRIEPACHVAMFCVVYQDKPILVVRVPAGDSRPYKAPPTMESKDRVYYVRRGAETEEARGDLLNQLLELTNRRPFDARVNSDATVNDISPTLVRRFLSDVRSGLAENGSGPSDIDLYQRLDLVARMNGHIAPRNVALLFFNEHPERFFRGAKIEVAQFGDDAGGDTIEERTFLGPLSTQAKEVLNYLNSLSGQVLRKQAHVPEVEKVVAYPHPALEEALVNAVYHRSYQEEEPTKVYLYPGRMEIISYPGPVAGISREHFSGQRPVAPAPARNSRIGEFLKDLQLAEKRSSGIPKIKRSMKENGSGEPVFEFDDARTWFRVTLPAHPKYQALHAIREAAHLWATGEKQRAIERLRVANTDQPFTGAVAGLLIQYLAETGEIVDAGEVFRRFRDDPRRDANTTPFERYASALRSEGRNAEAMDVLLDTPVYVGGESLDQALLLKRGGDYEGAHRVLAKLAERHANDAKFLQEYAQTKMKIAGGARRKGDVATNRKLLSEAESLLQRAVLLADAGARRAWCWFDLAQVRSWLRKPDAQIEEAYKAAIELLPGETRFAEGLEEWRRSRS